tara:strand:- start:21603 stop:23210 length:1608 start_codon:yes stop_codon:yes gene_type:complete
MKRFTGTILLGLCLFSFLSAVRGQQRFSKADLQRGSELADTYCSVCHLRPDPGIVSRKVWDLKILPNMAAIMGLFDEFYGDEKENILKSGKVLRKPLLPMDQYKYIAAYYVSHAPIELTLEPRQRLRATDLFRIHTRRFVQPLAMDALAKVDERNGDVFVGSANPGGLQRMNVFRQGVDVLATNYVPTRVVRVDDGIYVTGMKRYIPTELQEGLVQFIPREGDGYGEPVTLLDGLPRTSDLHILDMNGDGRDDILLGMFGFYTGRFSWFENLGKRKFREHVLFDRSGAVRAIVKDLNSDGHRDIAVLIAQEIETLYFLINDGTGKYDAEVIMRQHPAWGYTNFELVDINQDGMDDLLTTNGDFDYDAPNRPYHGFRIYNGVAWNRFEEAFFHEIGGAYDFAAEDFDADGDVDIVTVGYTPVALDSERLLYFENRSAKGFGVLRIRGAEEGRWLQVDAGDVTGDGKPDLVLSCNVAGPGTGTGGNFRRYDNWKAFPVANLILENTRGETSARVLEQRLQERASLRGGAGTRIRFIP